MKQKEIKLEIENGMERERKLDRNIKENKERKKIK